MSILVQYAPYHLREGVWDDAKRDELGDIVVKTLAGYAPNIEAAILHRQILTPLDLESLFGLTEGNIYHGEMTLDRLLFMRPVPGWARYRAPIDRLVADFPGGRAVRNTSQVAWEKTLWSTQFPAELMGIRPVGSQGIWESGPILLARSLLLPAVTGAGRHEPLRLAHAARGSLRILDPGGPFGGPPSARPAVANATVRGMAPYKWVG